MQQTGKISMKWDNVELCCHYCGSDMIIESGDFGTFYRCEKYPACANRMATEMYEVLLKLLAQLYEENEDTNLTHYKINYRKGFNQFSFTIKKHNPSSFLIAVANLKTGKRYTY